MKEQEQAEAETEELLKRYKEEKNKLITRLLDAGVMPNKVLGKSLKELKEINLTLWGG